MPVKNIKLAKKAREREIQFLNSELKENRFVLNILSDVDYKELPYYYSGKYAHHDIPLKAHPM